MATVEGWMDESAPTSTTGIYVLLAVVILPNGGSDQAREQLCSLLPPRVRSLHWHRERRPERRKEIITVLNRLDVEVHAAVAHPVPARRQEQARAACLTAILGDLPDLGTLHIEARTGPLNLRDRHTLLNIHRSGTNIPGMVLHQRKTDDPLLWAADAAASILALGQAWHRPGDAHWDRRFRPPLRSIRWLPPQ